MNEHDKKILFQDLCARLPYRTMVGCNTDYRHKFDEELSEIHIMNFYQFEIKPYLRPMSSMTEEEKKEYHKLCDNYYDIYFDSVESIDWLNKKMFAYRRIDDRDMFELGLALEAPEGMYD